MNDSFKRGAAAEIGPLIREKLALGETVTLQISGDSMRPFLKPGRDAAVLESIRDWPPKRGDVLFFQRADGGYVLHRVRKISGEGLVMNGDAQTWTEGPVTREMAVALASGFLRKGKLVTNEQTGYRLYKALWPCTRPLRRGLFALWRGVKKLLGKG